MLTKRARTALGLLAKAAKGSKHILSVNGHGEYFTADGRLITHKGIFDLIEEGVLVANGDALLSGQTQTYSLNLTTMARNVA